MKKGDKVVCIHFDKGFELLTIGKVYRLLDAGDNEMIYSSTGIYYLVKNDNGNENYYYYSKFVSLKEYRKMKLKKIRYESNL
jgi:hypothetical protein